MIKIRNEYISTENIREIRFSENKFETERWLIIEYRDGYKKYIDVRDIEEYEAIANAIQENVNHSRGYSCLG